MIDYLFVIRNIYKKTYLNSYLDKRFCQTIKKLFSFISSHNSFFLCYENFVLIFALVKTVLS